MLFVVVQSLSCVWFFATPWAAAHLTSLSFTISQGLLRFMSQSWWCYLSISSSAVPFFSCPQALPASGSFLQADIPGCIELSYRHISWILWNLHLQEIRQLWSYSKLSDASLGSAMCDLDWDALLPAASLSSKGQTEATVSLFWMPGHIHWTDGWGRQHKVQAGWLVRCPPGWLPTSYSVSSGWSSDLGCCHLFTGRVLGNELVSVYEGLLLHCNRCYKQIFPVPRRTFSTYPGFYKLFQEHLLRTLS